MKVFWADVPTLGTIVARAIDEDTGEPLTCPYHDDGEPPPLWRISFETASGRPRTKSYCCEREIVVVVGTA